MASFEKEVINGGIKFNIKIHWEQKNISIKSIWVLASKSSFRS